MSGRPKKREVRLVLYGVVFGILGQAVYDTVKNAVSPTLPPGFSGFSTLISALVAAGIFLYLISRMNDEPKK
jgi:hypothetical protein